MTIEWYPHVKSILTDQQKYRKRASSKTEGNILPENMDRFLRISPVWLCRTFISLLQQSSRTCMFIFFLYKPLIKSHLCSPALFLPTCLIKDRVFSPISREEIHLPATNTSQYFPYYCFINLATSTVTKQPGQGHALFSKPGIWSSKKHHNHSEFPSQTWPSELCLQISLLKIPKRTLWAKMSFLFISYFWNCLWK